MPNDPTLADLADGAGDLDAPPAVPGGVIRGHVRDPSGLPLVGVRVEAVASGGADLDLLPALSDGEGAFALEGLAEGRYDLRFALGQVRARVLGVPAGTTGLQARLARPQGLLLVTKTSGGVPPPAAIHVVLEREGRTGLVREHADRHLASRLLLWSLRPGRYRLHVWGGGHLPVAVGGVEVRPGVPAPEVEVVLGPEGARIEGRVVNAAGAPVPEALVAWRPLGLPGPWPPTDRALTAAADGTFTVRGLPAGRYRLVAGPSEGPFAACDVEVDEDAPPLRIELVMPGA